MCVCPLFMFHSTFVCRLKEREKDVREKSHRMVIIENIKFKFDIPSKKVHRKTCFSRIFRIFPGGPENMCEIYNECEYAGDT